MNVAFMKKVLAFVREHPDSLNMGSLFYSPDLRVDAVQVTSGVPHRPCGAIGCIVGWGMQFPDAALAGVTVDLNGLAKLNGCAESYDVLGTAMFQIEGAYSGYEDPLDTWSDNWGENLFRPATGLERRELNKSWQHDDDLTVFMRRLRRYCEAHNVDFAQFEPPVPA